VPELRDPYPPWLEYSFYVHERPSVDGFADLVGAVVADGAIAVEAAFYRGPGMRGRLAESLLQEWHEKPQRLEAPAADDVEALLLDPDVLVIAVDLENSKGLVPEAREQILFCQPYETDAVRAGRIPFELRTDGELLDFAPPAAQAKVGIATYERFRRLCEAVRPDYAACAEEENVEAVLDLEAFAFSEFYVRTGFLGEERARRLRALYAEAFVEEWADGFFVSTWPPGNPAGIGIPYEPTRAIEAGRIIAGLE
jgi:hypothetical protein